MKLSTLFFAALLGETARAYNLGDKATGTTDPDVTENCSQWANSIASGDTCKKLEADFNIDYLQLHEWASYQSTPDKTNSLAKLVGTEAPTLKNPNYTDSSSSSSATTTTATSSSSSSTNSTVTASLNSIATSTATESSSAQQTGNAASSGLTAIPIVMLFVAFSALALQLN
ncbi:hypothetical protein N7448_006552 [Penicillium atrosanguineum]|nr:hypothetical protein N7448_006552 [Penicillium atrosanguineum]